MTETIRPDPDRRRVLASLGAVGLGTYGFMSVRSSGSDGPYTNYTYAESHGPTLRVAWYSTYNGALLSAAPVADEDWEFESTDEYVDGVTETLGGPVVDVSNLLPGDSGTLSVGLLAESADARVWMRLRTDDVSAPLAEAIEVSTWYDTGIFGINGCQGAENGIQFDRLAEGTLADFGALSEGVQLNPGLLDNSVLPEGNRLCLALAWAFPTGHGNALQGTAAGFDLEFRAVDAADPNDPFAGEESS